MGDCRDCGAPIVGKGYCRGCIRERSERGDGLRTDGSGEGSPEGFELGSANPQPVSEGFCSRDGCHRPRLGDRDICVRCWVDEHDTSPIGVDDLPGQPPERPFPTMTPLSERLRSDDHDHDWMPHKYLDEGATTVLRSVWCPGCGEIRRVDEEGGPNA